LNFCLIKDRSRFTAEDHGAGDTEATEKRGVGRILAATLRHDSVENVKCVYRNGVLEEAGNVAAGRV
jgi:hypothetical protein